MSIPQRKVGLAGTEWSIPSSWSQTGEHMFQGPEGLLKLTLNEGDLIDPARLKGAQTARPGLWELARTRNGTAIFGKYRDREARVIVYSVRAEKTPLLGPAEFSLPEVQATYVLVSNEEAIFAAVSEALGQRNIHASEFGLLDNYGHAAMGPVPLLRSWLPVGDANDKTGTLGATKLAAAYPMLLGGGWIMFVDATKCCGVMLEPLAWRGLDERRAFEKLDRELGAKGLHVRQENAALAHVWKCQISNAGFSYLASDSEGNVRARGAFWCDLFGQVWRLQYWFRPEHAEEAERLLATVCAM